MKPDEKIRIAHGGGGRMTSLLIDSLVLPAFNNPTLAPLEDAAVIDLGGVRLAFTTDSYVVRPLFFPGGDIGKLAVCGTVNDLAVIGARPVCISCGLIIEEGLDAGTLRKVLLSMGDAARLAGVEVVTGDTKVVGKGEADSIFINTSGLGVIESPFNFGRGSIRAGDMVLINGPVGDHGMAVLSQREGLAVDSGIQSDVAPLNGLISVMMSATGRIRMMRDPTRGGLATALNEIVKGMPFGILLDESAVPVREETAALCEIIGFDPLYVANEGKVVAIAAREEAGALLAAMRSHPLGVESRIIGGVTAEPRGKVCLRTTVGGTRIVDMPAGEQLPRIC
ncbi:MAG: hydrogenase expression/formation protein HypE [Bacillota bacterium]